MQGEIGAATSSPKPIHHLIFRALVAGLLVASPLIYWRASFRVTSGDPFIVAQVAREMLAGKRLYLQTWDNKPPLAVLFYALPQFLGFRSYTALGFFQGIWIAMEGLLFFVVFRRNRAAALGCLALIVLFPMLGPDTAWPSTEHIANPFVAALLLLAYVILRDKRFSMRQCMLIGALAVAAFQIRQNTVVAAILPISAVAFAPASWRRKALGASAAILGAAVCFGIVLLVVLRFGDLHAYYNTIFLYPRRYAQAGSFRNVLYLLAHWPTAALPALLLWFLVPARRGGNGRFAIACVAVGLILCNVPKRPYDHYLDNLFPFLALLTGLALQRAAMPSVRARRASAIAILAVGILYAAIRLQTVEERCNYPYIEKVAQAADNAAPSGSTLAAFGPTPSEAITYLSKSAAANIYCWPYLLNPPWGNELPQPVRNIERDYLRHPPGVIVVDRNYLRDALGTADVSNQSQLLKRLFAANEYRQQSAVGDFLIFVNSRPNPRLTASLTPQSAIWR
jgi:hypothetical protein